MPIARVAMEQASEAPAGPSPSQEQERPPPQEQRRRRRRRQVCLFGTSANPPTGSGGHAGIVKALVDLRRFDEVLILPVYRHPFKTKRDQLACYDHRVAMCRLAFEPLGPGVVVRVSRAEEEAFARLVAKAGDEDGLGNLRVGTADLLEMLIEQEDAAAAAAAAAAAIEKDCGPAARGDDDKDDDKDDDATNDEDGGAEFSFCLGADTFMDLTAWKWKRSHDVLRLLEGRLVVVNRPCDDDGDDDDEHRRNNNRRALVEERVAQINASPLGYGGKIILIDVPGLKNVSSSMARSVDREDALRELVPDKVVDYIVRNKLYSFGRDGDGDDDDDVDDSQL